MGGNWYEINCSRTREAWPWVNDVTDAHTDTVCQSFWYAELGHVQRES